LILLALAGRGERWGGGGEEIQRAITAITRGIG